MRLPTIELKEVSLPKQAAMIALSGADQAATVKNYFTHIMQTYSQQMAHPNTTDEQLEEIRKELAALHKLVAND